MERPLNVLIYGTGAVGAVLGWRISQSSRAVVTAVCRTNFSAVAHSGFTINTSTWGSGIFRPHKTVRHPSEATRGPYDLVILATKLISDPKPVIQDLSLVISPGTAICSVQNGVGSDPLLASAFPGNPVLSAICYISLSQTSPGHVIQNIDFKCAPRPFGIGTYAGGHAAMAALSQLVSLDSEFETIECTEKKRWEKMVFNSAWNPSCALLGLDSDGMTRSPMAMQLVRSLAEETYDLARAQGVDLDSGIVDRTVDWAKKNAGCALVPSMLQDMRNGRLVEVRGLCSVLVDLARQAGLEVPTIGKVEEALRKRNQVLSRAVETGSNDITRVKRGIRDFIYDISLPTDQGMPVNGLGATVVRG